MEPKGKKALKCTNSKQLPRCGNWGGEIERECVIYMYGHNPPDFSN